MSSRREAELERRVFRFGVSVCRSLRHRPRDDVARHFSQQLIGSSTSPAAIYAEAQAAESRRDFVHKMQMCLKEFRETNVWLNYMRELVDDGVDRSAISKECDELTRIFVASIRTAKDNGE